MSKRRQNDNDDQIIVLYDENQEGLTSKNIWQSKNVTKVTSIKKEGWSGMSDSEIGKRLKKWEKRVLFITADKEKGKNKQFFPTKNVGIIRFGKNTTSLDQKALLLKEITKQKGFKKINLFIGKETIITSNTILWKAYKNPRITHKKQWKKSKWTQKLENNL